MTENILIQITECVMYIYHKVFYIFCCTMCCILHYFSVLLPNSFRSVGLHLLPLRNGDCVLRHIFVHERLTGRILRLDTSSYACVVRSGV